MRRGAPAAFLVVVATLAGGSRAAAEWSDDPSANLAIADRPGGQTVPLVASTSDGGVYVAWFDPAAGSFDVYLQRLDAAGVEQWPHNGLLVSDHPQNSALFGWDMIVDSGDNAVLVFSDERQGGDLDVYAYRIGPDGAMLWGADGVTLSANADFEPAPRVAETSTGDFVFVWLRDPAAGDGELWLQRLTADGVPQLAAGGVPVVAQAGETPGFVDVVPAEDGRFILVWLRNIATFPSPRHVRARKFDPAGLPVWPAATSVYDAFSVPIGYYPQILPDGADGAYLLWHRSDGAFFNSFVQHLDAAGTELFPHNGVAVSTTPNMHHLDPTFSIDEATGDLFVFWNERISNQSQWGIFGQKITPAGTRAWGGGGVALLPVDTTFKSFPRSVPADGGAMVFLKDVPAGTDRLIGIRVDSAGDPVWPASPRVVSDRPSAKSRYPVTIGGDGVAKLVWEDDSGAAADVYGQNVRPDGTLGVGGGPGSVGDSLRVGRSVASPGALTLSWMPSCAPGAQDYGIYEGQIGIFYGHVRKDCADAGGDLEEDVVPGPGDRYYLVVPLGSTVEGSYGTDSAGNSRPAATGPPCRAAQDLTPCATGQAQPW